MAQSKWYHCRCSGDGKSQGMGGYPAERCDFGQTLDALAVESSKLNSSFQRLNFVCWWGTALVKEMVKKMADSRMIWTGLWIEQAMGIDYAFWEI